MEMGGEVFKICNWRGFPTIRCVKVLAFKTYRVCWTLSYKGQKRASDKENNCNR